MKNTTAEADSCYIKLKTNDSNSLNKSSRSSTSITRQKALEERKRSLQKLLLEAVKSPGPSTPDRPEESEETADIIEIKEEPQDEEEEEDIKVENEFDVEDEIIPNQIQVVTSSIETKSGIVNSKPVQTVVINSSTNQQKQQDQQLQQQQPVQYQQTNTVTAPVVKSFQSDPKPMEKNGPAPEKVLYDNRIKRKNVLALNEKVAALREYEKEPVYKRVGRMFHCSPDQIKRIVQQKDIILKAWEQRTRRSQDAKTLQMKVVRVSMLGKAVYDWLRRMMYYKDFMITDGLIQKMALQFKSAMGLQNFFPHQEWCDKFRQTYNIKQNDTKLLNIGYTQGYSVQIKDVIKDILSECNPENEDDEDQEEKRTDENANEKNKDVLETNQQNSNTKQNIPTETSNTVLSSLPQLKPGTQLVALPLQGGNLGCAHKVLVATPIPTSNQIRSTQSMTMTIIPFATLSQSQLQNSQQKAITTSITSSNAAQSQSPSITTTITTSSTSTSTTAAVEKNSFPVPLVEIKKEIKEEPQDVYIKQECISEFDEDGTQDSKEFQKTLPPLVAISSNSSTISSSTQSLPQTGNTITNISAPSTNPAQAITIISKDALNNCTNDSAIDYDNLALSSLRKIIQNQNEATSPTSSQSADSSLAKSSDILTLTSALSKSLGPAVTLTKATPKLTPAPSVSPSSSNANTDNSSPPSPMPPLPPLIKAPNFNNNQQNNQYTNQASNIQSNAQQSNTNKRKRPSSGDSPMPPAIRSCTEARRYLKLLEDFALFRENFRLIGLITRADEVLRELEGGDNGDQNLNAD